MTAESINRHPRFQHGSVLLCALGVVGFAGYECVGGTANFERFITHARTTKLGTSHLARITDGDKSGATIEVGTAASTCIDHAAFSADRVRQITSDPDTYVVIIRKIGEGSLNAANIEHCILEKSSLTATVIEAGAHG